MKHENHLYAIKIDGQFDTRRFTGDHDTPFIKTYVSLDDAVRAKKDGEEYSKMNNLHWTLEVVDLYTAKI